MSNSTAQLGNIITNQTRIFECAILNNNIVNICLDEARDFCNLNDIEYDVMVDITYQKLCYEYRRLCNVLVAKRGKKPDPIMIDLANRAGKDKSVISDWACSLLLECESTQSTIEKYELILALLEPEIANIWPKIEKLTSVL